MFRKSLPNLSRLVSSLRLRFYLDDNNFDFLRRKLRVRAQSAFRRCTATRKQLYADYENYPELPSSS